MAERCLVTLKCGLSNSRTDFWVPRAQIRPQFKLWENSNSKTPHSHSKPITQTPQNASSLVKKHGPKMQNGSPHSQKRGPKATNVSPHHKKREPFLKNGSSFPKKRDTKIPNGSPIRQNRGPFLTNGSSLSQNHEPFSANGPSSHHSRDPFPEKGGPKIANVSSFSHSDSCFRDANQLFSEAELSHAATLQPRNSAD